MCHFVLQPPAEFTTETHGASAEERLEKDSRPFTRLPARTNRPQMKPLFNYYEDEFMKPYTGSAKSTELDDSAGQSDEDVELLNYRWSKKR
jgi:hypothetical protein